jgi:hypothetical protein
VLNAIARLLGEKPIEQPRAGTRRLQRRPATS